MSEDDSELQRLQAKRLAEMQKNISSRETAEDTVEPTKEKIVNPRDVLIKQLGFRGLEVLTNAESQFPNETKTVIDKLHELITNGEITDILDGGKLLGLFRSIGLSVRMDTKINIQQDGKFVSLTDKLSNASDEDDDA
ncbi:MAG: double-stranded DNA-binding protein [Nitrosopumilus sp.]|nr:double-stranded DNA-binding protein [Nitrosopumilus sp.]MBT3924580.1 double-stranded DNA-binding protein [Nitrosopumilus sp.]MBT4216800.1 double-stranded DNA-binding protein [Nitrosopumilus sp.]MBT4550405.1 double-stranded DNA-binding protein [Nitrosopumilus sp.]MBT7474026.1 double-stranded DNA-binding protein [Nitrosopumilus sp.]